MNKVERVILVVIDGLRPDGMVQAKTPNLDWLMERGAYSLKAQSVVPSITLPTHLSMFYGVPPEVHGVMGNFYIYNPDLESGIVERVHQAGYSSAAFYTWEHLRDVWRPGSIKHAHFLNIYSSNTRDFDLETSQAAVSYLKKESSEFVFVYLGMLDELAHKVGWMSPAYLEAIQSADRALGVLLEGLREAGLIDNTAILVQSDHGGHDHAHGTDMSEDVTIPWILSGPGVRRAVRLESPVSLLDTAPTIMHLLGLSMGNTWAGRVVLEALL